MEMETIEKMKIRNEKEIEDLKEKPLTTGSSYGSISTHYPGFGGSMITITSTMSDFDIDTLSGYWYKGYMEESNNAGLQEELEP